MGRFKELAILIKTKIQKILTTKKGKVGLGIGGCMVAAIVISTIAINSIGTSAMAAGNHFKINAIASSGAESSNTPGPTISTSSTSDATNIPVVSAAPTPSGAAPNAASALSTTPVISVDFNRHSLTLNIGNTAQLTTSITPSAATDKTLAWTSTNSTIATVDSSGNIKAVGAGTAYIRATNPDGQRDTCTVTVQGGSGGTGNTGHSTGNSGDATDGSAGNAGGTTGGGSGTLAAQYVRVDTTRTYTDEITGIQQTVHFQGVGFANEVGGGYADINTTPEMGAAHTGGFSAVYSLTGSNGYNRTLTGQGLAKNGQNGTFTFDNLTSGTYTLQLTAGDGTVVARYHFTVDSTGNVG